MSRKPKPPEELTPGQQALLAIRASGEPLLVRSPTDIAGGADRADITLVGLEAIEALASEGQDTVSIAKYLGCSKITFQKICKRQPEAEQALAQGRAMLADTLTHILLKQAKSGVTVAAIFLARSRCGFNDQAGTIDGGAKTNIVINLPDCKTPDEYLKSIQVIHHQPKQIEDKS